MRVHKVVIDYRQYQTIVMPNGAAPLSVQADVDNTMGIFFIGPDTLLDQYTTNFGVFVIPTAVSFPEDMRLFPVKHVLTQQVEGPNVHYLGTVNHHHIFLGNPREQLIVR